MQNPKCILLLSGKRKCGKDFLTDVLMERIGEKSAVVVRISAPIKSHWAKTHSLDLEGLMGNSEYKEKYRQDMVQWGENIRKNDYGYFCRAAVEMCDAYQKPVWIVSDVRRKTDIKWFKEKYGDVIATVRVIADDEVRKKRGWIFIPGVDDAETECDLDDVIQWDWTVKNNGYLTELEDDLKNIVQRVNAAIP